MDERDRYWKWMLDTAVAAVQDGTVSLRQLVERCEGADPLTVRSALADHVAQGLSLERLAAPAIADGPVERHLPPPHPLDYEWRFSQRGAESILSRARAAGARDLTFMGTTTAAVAAARQGGWDQLVAFDRSRTILDAVRGLQLPLELVVADVSSHVPTVGRADTVIIDPPWYLEHTSAFIAAAARECRTGGLVLASLPGIGTRPGIHAERLELKRRASSLGLEVLCVEVQSIAYETPLFERNAFRAAGLRGDMRSWRRGDLWSFRKVRDAVAGETLCGESGSAWEEMGVGRMRVRYLATGQSSGDTRLLQIVDGDVLPTVSRRDTRRDRVRVWTSGNRVFACDDPGTLFTAFAAATRGNCEVAAAEERLGRALTADERAWLAASCTRIGNLGVIEEDEYTDLTEEDGSDEHVAD